MALAQVILEWLAHQVINIIGLTGYIGVFFLMALESANIPIPSEVIMPFSGFAASLGKFSFWTVVFVGALGNLAGSIFSYWIGLKGGRPFLEKYGKYFLISEKEIEIGDRAFSRHGLKIAFWSRLLPIVRTFVSFPAGVNRAPLKEFALYTFLGSFMWSAFLAGVGFWLGENWRAARPFFEQFSFLILGLIILGIIIYIWKHIKHNENINQGE